MSCLKRCYNGCELISSLHDWISLFQIKFPSLADSAAWNISLARRAKPLESIFSTGRGRKCCLKTILIILWLMRTIGDTAQCSGQTQSRFFTVLIFSGEQKTLPHMKFSYFLTSVSSSHILSGYILHIPAFLYEWSGKWSSLPDKHFLLMLALFWLRRSQHETSHVHWKIWEWSDPESVLGKRGMRWDLKANKMPFCSTYSPPVASEGPDEREK